MYTSIFYTYIYVYAYMYIYMFTCIYLYMYTHIWTCTHLYFKYIHFEYSIYLNVLKYECMDMSISYKQI